MRKCRHMKDVSVCEAGWFHLNLRGLSDRQRRVFREIFSSWMLNLNVSNVIFQLNPFLLLQKHILLALKMFITLLCPSLNTPYLFIRSQIPVKPLRDQSTHTITSSEEDFQRKEVIFVCVDNSSESHTNSVQYRATQPQKAVKCLLFEMLLIELDLFTFPWRVESQFQWNWPVASAQKAWGEM